MCFIYTHISVTKHSCPCRGRFEINAYGKKRSTAKTEKLESQPNWVDVV